MNKRSSHTATTGGDCILRKNLAFSKEALLEKANNLLDKAKAENSNKELVNVKISDKPLTIRQMTKEKADKLGYLY